MAKRFAVTGTQHKAITRRWDELLKQLENRTGSPINPDLIAEVLKQLLAGTLLIPQVSDGRPYRSLDNIHFTDVWEQMRNISRWNKYYKWGLDQSYINKVCHQYNIPYWPSNKMFALVLVPYLETPLQTFNALAQTMLDEHWQSEISPSFDPSVGEIEEQFFEVCGTPHFTADCSPSLRWELIDLSGGQEWKPEMPSEIFALPPVEQRPNAGILAALAHFPHWARQLNYLCGGFGVVATGYKVKYFNYPQVPKGDHRLWGNPCAFTHLDVRLQMLKYGRGCELFVRTFEEGQNTTFASPILLETKSI